jgi:hypothetical protein
LTDHSAQNGRGKSEWLQHEFANDVARLLMTNHPKGSRDRLFEGRALDLSF